MLPSSPANARPAPPARDHRETPSAGHRTGPNPAAAPRFDEWALAPQAQQFAFAARGFQVPSNVNTPVDARVPDIKKIKLIDYDYRKYGSSAERKRIIQTWEEKVRALPQ